MEKIFYVKITKGLGWYKDLIGYIFPVVVGPELYYLPGTISVGPFIGKTHAEPVHLQELPFAIGQEIEGDYGTEYPILDTDVFMGYVEHHEHPIKGIKGEYKTARAIEEKKEQSELFGKIEQLQAQIDQLRKEVEG